MIVLAPIGGDAMRLQTKLVILVTSILTISLVIMYVFLSSVANQTVEDEVSSRARAVSAAVAMAPVVSGNMTEEANKHYVQEYVESMRQETGADFIVVFDMKGLRLSHPNAELIGQHIRGDDEGDALRGLTYVSKASGTLGPSMRAFHPIYHDGRQVGAVMTGISMQHIYQTIAARNLHFLLIMVLVFCCGIGATLLVAHRIKATLLGMEPLAIARLTVERNMVIQSVREGVVVVDRLGRLLIVNEEAERIFRQAGVTGPLVGENSERVIPNTRMLDIVKSGKAELDREQRINSLYILTNRVPLIVNGKVVGALATFRDLAEVRQMAEELTGVKRYVEALRAQAHEFRNKLHVINGLIINQRYTELSAYVQHLALAGQNEIKWIQKHVQDPVVSAFLQSKLSRSREMDVHLLFHQDMEIPPVSDGEFQNGLITILGNLLDNAMEAVQFTEQKTVELLVREEDGEWFIQSRDTGSGVDPQILDNIFQRGYSTKGENRGFGLFLVGKVVEKYGGTIRVTPNGPQGSVFTIRLYPMEEEQQ